ncbi:MAG TPA: dihydrolipoamide acetyltransferase family protein, partial [Anaeromyxobacteraceae bacterium]|nr:dihydrolipoamide acetyltransferase family protein [Anaeromyxobacteraceae bacterium]
IVKWLVKPGDVILEDQPLVEVMTDKATVTIPSPRRGRVTRLFWKEGDVAKVHAPLLEMEVAQQPSAPGPAEATRSQGAPAPAQAAPVEGAHRQPSPPGRGRAEPAEAAGGEGARGPAVAAPGARKALATPAVRAAARQMGVDINSVAGTGPGGRVTRDDLARGNGNGHGGGTWVTPAASVRGPPAPAGPAPAEERVPLRGVRRRIAEKMAQSKRTAAHFTYVDQVDVTELKRTKEKIAAAAGEEGVRVTYLPFIVKAAVAALKRFPQLNASLDEEKQEIVVKRHYDVGIASATDAGLMVPVVRGADRLSLLDLAREIERLAQDAKAGKARPEDQGGSTFTVTSLGALGGLFATPVINYPEVAILGIHSIRPTPVARDGQVVIREVMHLSLTSDHRVVDGHVAAAFTAEVIRLLEEPSLLFMQMV